MARVNAFSEQEKNDRAEDLLKQYLKNHAKDAFAWRKLGVLLALRSDYQQAGGAFFRAASLSQGREKGINRYLLADALARAGEEQSSRKTLETLRSEPGFEQPITLALANFQADHGLPDLTFSSPDITTSTATTEDPLKITASLKSGYTSNVLTLPDIATTEKPGSAMLSPAMQLGYTHDALGGNLAWSGIGMYTENFAQQATPYNSLYFMAGADWTTKADPDKDRIQWALGNSADISFLNQTGTSPYVVEDTLTPGLTQFLGKDHSILYQLPVAYHAYPSVTADTPADDRVGPSVGVNVAHRHKYWAVNFSEGVTYSYVAASGDNFKEHSILATLSASVDTFWQLNSALSFIPTYSVYPVSDSARRDENFDVNWDWSRKFPGKLPMTGVVSFGLMRNLSNVTTAQYSNDTITLKLTYDIK